MLDDGKRIHAVKLLLTEREYFALAAEADREDRKIADMGHAVLRWYLFGRVDGKLTQREQIRGAESEPEGA
jgi:hypothetical protein